jgi:hypothetical protein
MHEPSLEHSPRSLWAPGDESSPTSRSERDERAISLAGQLLMAGVALERQVINLVRARSRS